jgi:hypothetical protein
LSRELLPVCYTESYSRSYGKDGVTKRVKNMFKTYHHRENQKMGVEDKTTKTARTTRAPWALGFSVCFFPTS